MDEWFGKRTGSDPPFPVRGVPLESETLRQLEVAFTPELRDEAKRILEEQCGKNIPGWEIFSIADLRVTIIKASGGSLERLQRAVDVAKVDFRDAFSLLDGSGTEDLLEAIQARPVLPASARRRRGIPGWLGPIVGPIVGMLLVLPAFSDADQQGSIVLGLCVGAGLGLIAGLVMWASNRKA